MIQYYNSARRKPRKGIETVASAAVLLGLTQHVGNLGRGLKPRFLIEAINDEISARRKPRKGIETNMTHIAFATLLSSARRKPRKGIETGGGL